MNDWFKLCRQTVLDQIQRIERNEFCLHAPPLTGERKQSLPKNQHAHPLPELGLQISGEEIVVSPYEKARNAPGECIVVPGNLPHAGLAGSISDPCVLLCLTFRAENTLLLRAEGPPGGEVHGIDILAYKTPDQQRIIEQMDRLAEAYNETHIAQKSEIKGLLLCLFSTLAKLLETPPDQQPTTSHPKISQCNKLVAANLPNPNLNVNFLAERLSCSPTYLSGLFHSESGIRLSAYINQQRIHLAKRLLKTSSFSVLEISNACGYRDPNYLARIFKRETGTSPSKWRAQVNFAKPDV